MKIDLGYWWPFAQTAWGWTVATVGGLAALYYGPRKMFETFDWYMDRFFDHKVLAFLESHITIANYVAPNALRPQWATMKSVPEIAKAIGFSEKRVLGCLRRLKRKKEVVPIPPDLWKVNIPPHTSI